MPADSLAPTVLATSAEHRLPSSLLVRAAGCISAAILVLVFANHAYWAIDPTPDFRAQLPVPVVAALTTVWTLGAAALLLTRIGILALPLPRWLLRAGPWVLTAFLGFVGATHLLALASRSTGDWRIDLQGPLLLLLAGLCIVVASEEPAG